MRCDPPAMVSGRDLTSETSSGTSAIADFMHHNGRAAIYTRVESGLIVRASARTNNDFGLDRLQVAPYRAQNASNGHASTHRRIPQPSRLRACSDSAGHQLPN